MSSFFASALGQWGINRQVHSWRGHAGDCLQSLTPPACAHLTSSLLRRECECCGVITCFLYTALLRPSYR